MSSKQRIEAIAQNTVQRSGLKNLSFRTLGAEVGVKSSSVHYHFPEKSDLGDALIQRYHDSLILALADITQQSTTAYTAIKLFIENFEKECKEGKLCFAGMLAAEVEFLSESNQEHLKGLFEEFHRWLENEFNRAGDSLNIDLPAPTLARLLLASLEGSLLIDRAHTSDDHLRAVNVLVDSWFRKIN